MRYYCYNVWQGNHADEPYVEVMSEKEILELHYDHWYDAMVSKFGKEVVDRDYCKDDCIDDWVVVNWAWESTDE